MLRPLLVAALAAVATSLPSAATGSPVPMLQGVTGPGFVITLKDSSGATVTHLDPARYLISIDDRSDIHNFHLTGPGVNMATDLEGIGTTTWDVNLGDGAFRFLCDAHPNSMRGSFTVGTTPPPPPPAVQLSGKVSSRAISLTRSGTRVRSVTEGTFKVRVTDTSKKQNFHLKGSGVNRKTGIAAITRKTWTVKLVPGKYVYRSDKSRRLRGTFTVRAKPPPA
jgi:hypothetical protein